MQIRTFIPILLAATCAVTPGHAASLVNLGSASNFAVLAGAAITNTGPSIINGNIGVGAAGMISGFPPGVVNGSIHAGDALAVLALADLVIAAGGAGAQSCGTNLTGFDLGTLVLTPGVYCFASSAQLTGALTLDGLGDASAEWLFQIGSTLTTATAASVVFTNGASGGNLYWLVGSSATLGTGTAFGGTIMALASITVTTAASIVDGRLLARTGAVTLDSNDISGPRVDAVPEPLTWLSMLVGFGAIGSSLRYRRGAIAG